MQFPKKYFQDKILIGLAAANIILMLFVVLFVFLRVDGGRTNFMRFRSNVNVVDAFTPGKATDLYSFGVFALLATFINIILSLRLFNINRSLSVLLLGFGILLLIFCFVVSNALLNIH
jgi:hypothetical protein